MQQRLLPSTQKNNLTLHPTEPLLVVHPTITGTSSSNKKNEPPPRPTLLRIDPLPSSFDECVAMAAALVATNSKCLLKSHQSQVEQLLHQFYQRLEGNAEFDHHLSPSTNMPFGAEEAKLEHLHEYLEMLYDDAPKKVEGTAKILQLTRNAGNLEALLLKQAAVLSTLARVLGDLIAAPVGVNTNREGGGGNRLLLLYNLLRIFLVMSNFYEMQELLVEHGVGSLTMRALDKEFGVFFAAAAAKEKQRGGQQQLHQQQQRHERIFFVALYLLLNLARGNPLVEEKMVKRQLIARYLLPLLLVTSDNSSSSSNSNSDPRSSSSSLLSSPLPPSYVLLLLVLTFLKRLSIYEENVEEMRNKGHLMVGRLIQCIPCSHVRVTETALGLVYNLAFDQALRREMIKQGLLPKLVALVKTKQPAGTTHRSLVVKILYQISYDDTAKQAFGGGACGGGSKNSQMIATSAINSSIHSSSGSSSSAIPLLKDLIFHFPRPTLTTELAALAVNMTWEGQNVEQFCEKAGLRRLMDRVIKHQDPLAFKIIRNVSQWSLATQTAHLLAADPEQDYPFRNLWPSHIKPLLALLSSSALSSSAASSSSSATDSAVVILEIMGTLANLTPLDLPVGLNWHDFEMPLGAAGCGDGGTGTGTSAGAVVATSLLDFCKSQLLLVSSLSSSTPEAEKKEDGGNQHTHARIPAVDLLLQTLLFLQALALDPVFAIQMTQDELLLAQVHASWCNHVEDEPEIVLQGLVLFHRLLLLSNRMPGSGGDGNDGCTITCIASSLSSSLWGPGQERLADVINALRHGNTRVRRVAAQCIEILMEAERDEEGKLSDQGQRLRQARFDAAYTQDTWC